MEDENDYNFLERAKSFGEAMLKQTITHPGQLAPAFFNEYKSFGDLKEAYNNKTIGKEYIDNEINKLTAAWNLLPDGGKQAVIQGLQGVGNTYQDLRTIDDHETWDPSAWITSGAIRGLEGVGWAADKFIAKPVAGFAHNQLGIDKRGADTLGFAADVILGDKALSKLSKLGKLGKLKKFKNANKLDDYLFNRKYSKFSKDWNVSRNDPVAFFTKEEVAQMGLPDSGQPLLSVKKSSPGQLDIFDIDNYAGPIDPASKAAYNIYIEALAKKSGYDTFKMMKKEIFDKWPEKNRDQVFRQLWQGSQTNYVGYAEHLTAKASKKLRREKLAKKYPNETSVQIDKRLADKSKDTFDMDWYWDKDWIDSNGVRRTDGLGMGDRNAPDNMRLLFNDRLKSVKDVVENIGYGTEAKPGILWGDPKTKEWRSPNNRFLLKFEDPQRKTKKLYMRQNPGDVIIYRASNGNIIGNLGQYLDVLYPKNTLHPVTKKVINVPFDNMKKGVLKTVNPKTKKLFTSVEEFREFIISERLEIILRDTANLPKVYKNNSTARKRYIKKFVDQDMVDLFEKYPWLPKPPAVMDQIFSKGSGMTQEDILKRGYNFRKGLFPDIKERHTYGGHIRETTGNSFKQILLDIFGPDDR